MIARLGFLVTLIALTFTSSAALGATLAGIDDVTVAVLLAIPEALAGPERLHHVLSSLLIRGGVGAPEVTDAVKTYRSFAKTLR